MRVAASTGNPEVAMVYVIEFEGGKLIECVEAVQPPIPIEKKWVLLISTMFGCPVGCAMCDAGGFFQGKCSKEQVLAQIDFLVDKKFPNRSVPSEQFKIQFARMGEPTLNAAVLDALAELPTRVEAPGLMPSLSTIAPKGADGFLERLIAVKDEHYGGGRFQFQFSLHTTDEHLRDQILPVRKWSFGEMAAFGQRYHKAGDRKITLNFALAQSHPVEPDVLLSYFDPETFLVKITPLNPTHRARERGLTSYIDPNNGDERYRVVDALRAAGYEVIVSIGELEENRIGSNCGQYVVRHMQAQTLMEEGYTYRIHEHAA